MDQQGGFFHITRQKGGQRLERALNALVYGNVVVQRGFFQYPVDDFSLVARMAYSQAQAPVIATSELGVDVTQAVVSGVATAELQFDLAGRNVEFIVRYQDFLRRDLEKACQ